MRTNKARTRRRRRPLRSLLHWRGLRYRVPALPAPTLRRAADLVFMRARVAHFVDGVTGTAVPRICGQPRPTAPSAGQDRRHRIQDAETDQILAEEGWDIPQFWEHEGPEAAAERGADLAREKTAAATATRSPSQP
ncbi:very short patch repair endonuclease [Streptomyces anulatus]